MVGYHKNDSMTVNEKLFAGCFAGCFTRFLTQPVDVIKIRVQLQRKRKKGSHSSYRMATRIFTEEGLKAFWQGHTLGQLHSMVSVGSQFYIYELLSQYVALHYDTHRHKNIFNYMCGAVAGTVSCTLNAPMEVIRVRQILVPEQYKGIISGTRAVYRSGGFFAFYEGLSASLIQIAPAAGASFTVFNIVQKFILHKLVTLEHSKDDKYYKGYEAGPLLIASTVAGSAAGLISKTLVYPFDLAKRRLQISSHAVDTSTYKTPGTSTDLASCDRLFSCLVRAYKSEGIRGLYRGWAITAMKAQMSSILLYTTYELTCFAVRKVETISDI